MAGAMLGPVVARLAREQAGGRLESAPDRPEADPGSFSDRLAAVASIAAEDLELLGRHDLVRRSPTAAGGSAVPASRRAFARLADLIMTSRPLKETHA
jgi:hypothetical protein